MSKSFASVKKVVLAAVVVMLGASACASSSAMGLAAKAEEVRDYDLAVAEYTKALRARPNDQAAQMGLDRARLRASEAHFLRGRRLFAVAKFEDAVIEFQLASELNPGNGDVDRDLRATRMALRNRLAVESNGQTALEAVLAKTRSAVPASLDMPDTRLPASITTGRDTTNRNVFQMIGKLAELNVIFDPQFRDVPAFLELKNLTLKEALDAVASSTGTFYRITAPGTITVIPDTAAKRREYMEEMVQSFYIGNADMKETIEMLRIVADARAVAAVAGTSSIVIRDTPERLQAVQHLLKAVDKARPEVVIDVEILEVDRSRLREYGLQIASPGSPGINGGIEANSDALTLQSLRNISRADALISGFPALYYRLLKTDTSTRTLANPHLRAIEGVAATAKFGEQVPVPNVTFQPLAAGGVSQQAITGFEYRPIGVNIDITPRTHPNDDVTLTLKIELSSVAGSGYNGLPTFANRQITTQIRLRDGETNILAGLIRDDERTTLSGIPGLSDIPVIGRLFARNQRERTETDIVLTLTPHIIRVLDLTAEDLTPLKLTRDTGAPGLADAPPMQGMLPVEAPKPEDAGKPKVGLPPSPLIIKKQ
jgi:general secretion pathway protein D